MYEIKLHYPTHKQFETSNVYKESITHCASIDLFLKGLHTSQTSASRIAFESERDRTLGILILSSNPRFTVTIVE